MQTVEEQAKRRTDQQTGEKSPQTQRHDADHLGLELAGKIALEARCRQQTGHALAGDAEIRADAGRNGMLVITSPSTT